LWDLETKKEVLRREWRGITSRGIAFLPDGRRALLGTNDGAMILWDLDGEKEVRRWQHPGPVRSLTVSADGRYALTGGDNGTLWLWGLPE